MINFVFLLYLFNSHAFADKVAAPAEPGFDSFFHAPSSDAQTDVQKELECIQFRTQDKIEMIKQTEATQMIKLLAPAMEDGFRKFKVTPIERAFFYSQAIEESGGFTQLSESKTFASAGNDPLGQVITTTANDRNFKTKANATTSRQFGVFRGRGLVQISRCDNYLSVIHYLNLLYAQQTPEWKGQWNDAPTKTVRHLSTVCSKQQLDSFISRYRRDFGMNANLYGALDDPMRFAMIGSELTDPVTGKKIASEQFMVDASLAYWRGRCGETVDHISNAKALANYKPCARFAGGDYLTQATKCLTYCIKGSTGGWQRRMGWVKEALLCGRL